MTHPQPPYDGTTSEAHPQPSVPNPWADQASPGAGPTSVGAPGQPLPPEVPPSPPPQTPAPWGGGIADAVPPPPPAAAPTPGPVAPGPGGYNAVHAAEEIFSDGGTPAAPTPSPYGQSPGAAPHGYGFPQPVQQAPALTAKDRKKQERKAKQKATAAAKTKAKNKKTNKRADTPASQGRADERFDVPRPGGRLGGGRGTHVAARMTALVTGSLLALGTVGVMAYTAGHPAPVESGITDAQVSKYRLTSFPTERAIAFADRYARLCANQNPQQAQQRQQAIARLSSSGVDTACGWDGKGKQVVAYSVWSGYMEPIAEYPEHGYYIGIQVQLTSGALRTLSVPVWVDDLKSGNGMRVVGDVGTLPQPDQATPPPVDVPLQVDSQLSGDLKGKLFGDFFTSWGASDGTTLTRYVAPGASEAARAGLRGALQSPKVSDVKALLPQGVTSPDEHRWQVGDTTWAWVSVRWRSGDAHVTERYRVHIVLTDQGWFVNDIRAGVPDQDGGKASS